MARPAAWLQRMLLSDRSAGGTTIKQRIHPQRPRLGRLPPRVFSSFSRAPPYRWLPCGTADIMSLGDTTSKDG